MVKNKDFSKILKKPEGYSPEGLKPMKQTRHTSIKNYKLIN